MEILKISAIVLTCVVLSSCLPLNNKAVSSLITISTAIIVLIYVIKYATPAIENIKSIFGMTFSGDFEIVLKAMGISIITQFVADVAIDSGNKAMANQMVFAGKSAIVILAAPVFVKVMEIIGNLLK